MRTPPERVLLGLSCLAVFIVILDATIVAVALPDIRDDLDFSGSALPWVVNAYTLAFSGFLLIGGRCADFFGTRRMMPAGLVLFTLASLACGLVDAPGTLLAARAVQGLGGALLMPTTLTLLQHTFPDGPRRTRALMVWSMVGAVGSGAGTVLGGVLTDFLNWRWVFLVNVPLGVLALLVAWRVLPVSARAGRRGRIDVVGALLATGGLTLAVYGTMESVPKGWTAPAVWGSVAGGLTLFAVFLVHQGRWAREPLVPLDIFRARSVSGANVVMFLMGLGFFASPVLLSLYLQGVHAYSPLEAGLAFLPIAGTLMIGARGAGALMAGHGTRRITVGGAAIAAVGFLWLALGLGEHGSYVPSVGLPGALFGLGIGACFTPIAQSATAGVPRERAGLASGLLNTTRQVSGAVGLAVLSTIAAEATGSRPTPAHLAHGYAVAFAVAAGCAGAAALAAALAMVRDHPRTSTPEPVRTPVRTGVKPR
ncbi:MFS transporter [Embleya scabrispora]|uniref:MFS transporter n=1 Tax=Embleya scabrispora TaxID=159449 RepID=UPI000381C49D|nr:MFS transporter [Embleya scabrispora]MYS82355.1 DHA2 family efflux MFS transporter permease subunit [Streptomyces sp. SID5474]